MKELTIAGVKIAPGEHKKIELPMSKLYTDTGLNMPISVWRSKKDGPTLLVCAAMHGDELNGIEIVGRIMNSKQLARLRGTLIAVPIINSYGVINLNRYLPDGRDLNRSFPGSKRGSLASRMAYRFINEVVTKCDYGIDLHTGGQHRSNLPQIRANLSEKAANDMAHAFGVPVLLNSNLRDGSLRQAADELGIPMILYEGGQSLRFDELPIRAGVNGVLRVMRHLKMLPARKSKKKEVKPRIALSSSWVRAPDSGIVTMKCGLGDFVEEDDVMAEIRTPFGEIISQVVCAQSGIVIGQQNIPLIQEGEAMFHVAYYAKPGTVVENLGTLEDGLIPNGPTTNIYTG